MNENDNHLKNLAEIRSIMERSTSFISLSGLSGVFAGIFALIGAFVAFKFFGSDFSTPEFYNKIFNFQGNYNLSFILFGLIDSISILTLAIAAGIFFSIKKSKKNNTPIWDKSAKRLISNLLIPLISGALLALIMIYHKQIQYISAITLIFYGLALINASKYTLRDIRFLGIFQIIIGLCAALFVGYGLLFWTLGFGVLHIIYGVVMYFKYDR